MRGVDRGGSGDGGGIGGRGIGGVGGEEWEHCFSCWLGGKCWHFVVLIDVVLYVILRKI